MIPHLFFPTVLKIVEEWVSISVACLAGHLHNYANRMPIRPSIRFTPCLQEKALPSPLSLLQKNAD
jgi:hypothetical protein